jgi:hypothetical protein
MNPALRRSLHVSLSRFVVSVLFGAGFYLGWMALFLICSPHLPPLGRGALWILAPIVTGLGFAAGAVLFNRIRRLRQPAFGQFSLYPLIGCSVGAAVVFPFGPMLIVFGMGLLGSLAMLLFEFRAMRRSPGQMPGRRRS